MPYFNRLKVTSLSIACTLIVIPGNVELTALKDNTPVRGFAASPIVPLWYKGIAHNVEISNEVAATFHITPNHNPQAGQPAQAWFALTRRGGKTIPLSECNCALNVYTVPRAADAQPILQPQVSAIDVEKYQEIPGATIVFPDAGVYELELVGTAKDSSSFAPFKLTYTVNVIP